VQVWPHVVDFVAGGYANEAKINEDALCPKCSLSKATFCGTSTQPPVNQKPQN